VASERALNGLENGSLPANGSWDMRDDVSALQPAKANEINANTATRGRRREQSNATTVAMVTHSYATKYQFE
jgi:hypothetical protein